MHMYTFSLDNAIEICFLLYSIQDILYLFISNKRNSILREKTGKFRAFSESLNSIYYFSERKLTHSRFFFLNFLLCFIALCFFFH